MSLGLTGAATRWREGHVDVQLGLKQPPVWLGFFFCFFEAAPAEQMRLNTVLSLEQTEQWRKSGLDELPRTSDTGCILQ